MDERKMQAPPQSADVTRITHRPLYHVDEDFEAVRSHLPRHLHLINDHARCADPRVASRRIGGNELRRRRGVLRHPRVVGSGETELLLRAGDVLLGNADFARRLAHIAHAITAGETAPVRTAGPPERIGKAAQSGLDTSLRLLDAVQGLARLVVRREPGKRSVQDSCVLQSFGHLAEERDQFADVGRRYGPFAHPAQRHRRVEAQIGLDLEGHWDQSRGKCTNRIIPIRFSDV